jgi:hypothetical protein
MAFIATKKLDVTPDTTPISDQRNSSRFPNHKPETTYVFTQVRKLTDGRTIRAYYSYNQTTKDSSKGSLLAKKHKVKSHIKDDS